MTKQEIAEAVTNALVALNFGDTDEAREILRNLLEQLRKGAEDE